MNFQAPNMMPAPNAGPPMGNPPILGQQVPGMSGGLPSLSGLSVLNNPIPQELDGGDDMVASYAGGGAVEQAEQVRQHGRGEDTVLVHMTPGEVGGLQALAMAHGGSLTINPQTGLPEAGFLKKVFKKLLPTLAGVGLSFIPGVGPLAAAALTAAGGTAATGSLKKGLMAGLQAYGGASLATSLGSQGVFGAKAATAAAPSAAAGAAPASGITTNLGGGIASLSPQQVAQYTAAQAAAPAASGITTNLGGLASLNPLNAAQVAQYAAPQAAASTAKTGLAGVMQGFGEAAKKGVPTALQKFAPAVAGMGLMQGVTGALSPSSGVRTATGQIDNSYQGQYTAQPRNATFAPDTQDILSSSKERRYFDVDMPEIRNMQGQVTLAGSSTAPGTQIVKPMLNPKAKKGENMYVFGTETYRPDLVQGAGYAQGGEIELSDGAFVMDARTVSELGNGSSAAGQELLAKMGGRPVRGPGDGVSDSVPARIGRKQPARVARDEVIIPADAVKRIGKGNGERGAQKLYSLMNKAHKARKKAKRGQDTGLRRGLA